MLNPLDEEARGEPPRPQTHSTSASHPRALSPGYPPPRPHTAQLEPSLSTSCSTAPSTATWEATGSRTGPLGGEEQGSGLLSGVVRLPRARVQGLDQGVSCPTPPGRSARVQSAPPPCWLPPSLHRHLALTECVGWLRGQLGRPFGEELADRGSGLWG